MNKNVITVNFTEFSKELLNMELMLKDLKQSINSNVIKDSKETKLSIDNTILHLEREIGYLFILLQNKDISALGTRLETFKKEFTNSKEAILEEYQKGIIKINLKNREKEQKNTTSNQPKLDTDLSRPSTADINISTNPNDAMFRLEHNDIQGAFLYLDYVKDMIDNSPFVDSFGNTVDTNIKVLVKFKLRSLSLGKVSKFIFGEIPYVLNPINNSFNSVGRFIGNRRKKQSLNWGTDYEDVVVYIEEGHKNLYINNPVDLVNKAKAILYTNNVPIPEVYTTHPLWDIRSYISVTSKKLK